MSTTPDPVRPRSSAFGRYVFVFVLGLVLGAIAVVMIMRALNERRDHFPDSVMHVQAWHLQQLGAKATQHRCNATDVIPHLRGLRIMADDLERAFPDLSDDARFVKQASGMRATLDGALEAPPISCEGVEAVVARVGENCKACHQDFR